ncbi:hypothetical protein [Corynebacterium halotolerans]|uniref:Transcriptional regulator n=1 Tax=Corynebacterium halotolerans YIM 70093 = DSM 44683 TaxID=1121362 RepID=M1NZM8_9CORY|nr:hypothetical protein [Corynebacterium halotolerans]AGF72960.1 transcriptional regulator [Corynebacterium halotolerans YIM 70093 = DSM 44683]
MARSHDLLGEADRALLGRLSAFTGSFELDDAGTRPAYWRWAAESAGRRADEAAGPDAARALRRLDLASADLTAAAEQSLTAGRLDLAARTVGHVGRCILWIPGMALAEVTLAVGDHPRLPGVAGESLARGAAAIAAVERGELERAERLGRLARETATAPAERFLASVALGVTAVYAGDWELAVRRWRRVLTIDGLPAAYTADAHAVLALLLAATGSPGEPGKHAAEHAADARRAAERSGAPSRTAFALYASGEVLLATDHVAAVDVLREAARMADTANAVQVAAVARVALLAALTRTGRTAEAVDLSLTLLELQQRRSYWAQLWNIMRILAELFTAAGRLETAELILAAAEASESAPVPAGVDIERHRLLRRRVHEGLGTERADRIAAIARLLPRTEILNRARDTARALSRGEPEHPTDTR